MNFINKLRVTKPLVTIIGLISIAFLSVIFQGCEKSEFEDDMNYKLEIPDQYNAVGKMHNQGLNYVFNAIKEAHMENMKNSDPNMKSAQILDYKTIVTDATLQFCKETKSLKEKFNVCQAVVVKSHLNLKSKKIGKNDLDGMNSIQKELLNEIFYAMKVKYSKVSLAKIKKDLDKINIKALNQLSEIEAAPIYCATSTAFATYQYWHRNYKKWYFAIHYPEILKEYNDAQLNNLSLKNGELSLKSAPAWYDDIFDTVEGWWNDGSDAVGDWWDENGDDILTADCQGAAAGVIYAIDSGIGEVSLVFGPEGWVLTVVGGGVAGAVYGSALGAAWSF